MSGSDWYKMVPMQKRKKKTLTRFPPYLPVIGDFISIIDLNKKISN